MFTCFGRTTIVPFLLFPAASPALGIIMSSGGANPAQQWNNIVAPNTYRAVVGLEFRDQAGSFMGWHSGSILEGGNYILTSGNVMELAYRSIGGVQVEDIIVHYADGGRETIRSTAFDQRITFHPNYVQTSPNGDGFHSGYDVALLQINNASPALGGYALDASSRAALLAASQTTPLDLIGRGEWGHGTVGTMGLDGNTRIGFNGYENVSPQGATSEWGFAGYSNTHTMLVFDFDSQAFPNTNTWTEAVVSGEEAFIGLGDLGGPTFDTPGLIAGVHSFFARTGAPPDFTANLDSSWGEIGVDTWMGDPNIYSWVYSTVYGQTNWINTIGGSLSTGSNWYGGSAPGPGDSPRLSLGGTYSVDGPSTGTTVSFASMTVGGGNGYKTLALVNGGNTSISDTLTVERFGSIHATSGMLSADHIVISGPVSPSQQSEQGKVYLGSGSTLQVNEVDINAGGRFTIDTDATIDESLTNHWDLVLSDQAVGNTLSIGSASVPNSGSFTQTANGILYVQVAGAGTGTHDKLVVHGAAALDGGLALERVGWTPSLGDTFQLISSSGLTSRFSTVGGVEISPTQGFAVTYTPNAVNVTVARMGDATLDQTVDKSDHAAWSSHYGDSGSMWANGDFTGDGVTDIADFLKMSVNFASNVGWQGDGDTDGSWHDGGAWGDGIADGSGQLARFKDNGAAHIVRLDSNATVGTLLFDSPYAYTIQGSGVLNVEGVQDAQVVVLSGSHSVSVSTAFGSDAVVNIASGAKLSLPQFDWIDLFDGQTVTKSGAGELELGTLSLGGGTAGLGGTLNIQAGTLDAFELVLVTGSASNAPGDVTLSGGTLITGFTSVGLIGSSAATFSQMGGTLSTSHLDMNVFGGNGTYILSAGLLETNYTKIGLYADYGSALFQQSGGNHIANVITVGHNSTNPSATSVAAYQMTGGVTTATTFTIQPSGEFSFGGGTVIGDIENYGGMYVSGGGTREVQGALVNQGRLHLDQTDLELDDVLDATATSEITLTITDGTNTGVASIAANQLNLDGSLVLDVAGTATFTFYQTLEILTGTLGRYGTFDTIDGVVQANYSLAVLYGSDVVEIAAVYAGDANLDGLVDAFDEAIVTGNMNSVGSWTSGDFNGDGIVDGDDYDIWSDNEQLHFASMLAVPEPASVALLLLGAAALTPRRRR